MAVSSPNREAVPVSTPSHNIAQRLKAQAERPRALRAGEAIDRYMAQYSGRDVTRFYRLTQWQEMLGDLTLEEIDSDFIHAARDELLTRPPLIFVGLDYRGQKIFKAKGGARTRSASTVNRIIVAMSAVFTWAIENRLTPKGWTNPCRGIKRLTESDGRVRFLDQAERTRLFAATRESGYPRLYAMTLMAMKTGARRGELLSLTWNDVDLVKGVATLGKTKNGDRRTLVLLPDVIEALRPFKSSDGSRYVFGSVRSKYRQPGSIQSAWRDAMARANIKNFKFHDLRHCCASYMAQAGIPLNVIAEVLGHPRLDMTKRYAHLTTQTKASAMLSSLGGIQ